jgi:DNA adenine methylase
MQTVACSININSDAFESTHKNSERDQMTYPGGKSGAGVYQQIINQIPPHQVYIEPFLGSGAVMRFKRPAIVDIGIDSDAGLVARWHAGEFGMPAVTVINADAISYLPGLVVTELKDGGDVFVYCDPPYLFDVRSSKRPLYTAEFGDMDQHEKLLAVLLALPCMVAISGYESPLYAAMLATWRTRMVTEWLWMNYPEPKELHDYRYLGQNYRERERLARMRRRWLARLGRMDTLERLMLSAAIAENGDAGHQSGA